MSDDHTPPAAPAGMLEFPCDVERLANGNTLIADAGDAAGAGSEIIEVDPGGQIVWRFAGGLAFAHSAKRLADGHTLIADTTNNRVLEVDRDGAVVLDSDRWSDGTGRLSDGSHLHYPNDAHALDDGRLMITDRNNNRFVVCDRAGRVSRVFAGKLRHPHNADPLPGGGALIADSDGNRIVELDADGREAWSFDAKAAGPGLSAAEAGLSWPRDADRLANGNTLVTDSKNCRLLEVAPNGQVVWQHRTAHFANLYDADRLANGHTLYSDQQHQQVVEIDRAGNVVWAFRNWRRTTPIGERLVNGGFREIGPDGVPAGWLLAKRLSEGGGRLRMVENAPRPCVQLVFDRAGALCLQQTVAVEPGRTYAVASRLRAERLEGVAFCQMAFVDALGGMIEDVIRAPRGAPLMDTTGWLDDRFEATAPPGATAADLRLFITGAGVLFCEGVNLETA